MGYKGGVLGETAMMVNLQGQLDWAWKHLGDTLLLMFVCFQKGRQGKERPTQSVGKIKIERETGASKMSVSIHCFPRLDSQPRILPPRFACHDGPYCCNPLPPQTQTAPVLPYVASRSAFYCNNKSRMQSKRNRT